jgi:homoserine O-acetyltransferase
MSQVAEIQYYHHGRFRVAGGVLPDAITAYQTFGNPKNPVIVFPTCYGGKLDSEFSRVLPIQWLELELANGLLGQSYMVGEDKVLLCGLSLFSS